MSREGLPAKPDARSELQDGRRAVVSLTVSAELNGVCVPLVLDSEALAGIAAALVSSAGNSETQSTYLTIPEAAELLRCKRQRIDDLSHQDGCPGQGWEQDADRAR